MTDETESALRWTEVTVPPNQWTKAMLTGDPQTDDWAGIEAIEVFHANDGDATFIVRGSYETSVVSPIGGGVGLADGWRCRMTPYIDWINRQHAERAAAEAAAEPADPLAGHPLTQASATERNVERGYIELQDDGDGKHKVVLTAKGAARARELLGLPADFPLNEVP